MNKQQLIERAVETAKAATVRDDICSRSVLIGLQTFMYDIPDELVTASLSLAGGTGGASGSCGAFCAGLLGVGLKFNAPVEDELENTELKAYASKKFNEYSDRFTAELGTVICSELHEKYFGRSYIFKDPEHRKEWFELEGHMHKCAEIAGIATRIAAEMILEDMED